MSTNQIATEPVAPTPWQPDFERWRGGGWYVTNISYPSGACGCVSNNYTDKKWRIVGSHNYGTFASRTEAAFAERALVFEMQFQKAIALLEESSAAFPQLGTDDGEVNGGDAVEFFGDWVVRVRELLNEARPRGR